MRKNFALLMIAFLASINLKALNEDSILKVSFAEIVSKIEPGDEFSQVFMPGMLTLMKNQKPESYFDPKDDPINLEKVQNIYCIHKQKIYLIGHEPGMPESNAAIIISNKNGQVLTRNIINISGQYRIGPTDLFYTFNKSFDQDNKFEIQIFNENLKSIKIKHLNKKWPQEIIIGQSGNIYLLIDNKPQFVVIVLDEYGQSETFFDSWQKFLNDEFLYKDFSRGNINYLNKLLS